MASRKKAGNTSAAARKRRARRRNAGTAPKARPALPLTAMTAVWASTSSCAWAGRRHGPPERSWPTTTTCARSCARCGAAAAGGGGSGWPRLPASPALPSAAPTLLAPHPKLLPLQLVRQLDGGGALDVSGIPDAFLRSRLLALFDNLVQLRKNSAVSRASDCVCVSVGISVHTGSGARCGRGTGRWLGRAGVKRCAVVLSSRDSRWPWRPWH